MSRARVSFRELNAFVDGEMQPDEAAHAGRAAAVDAELSQSIATLQTLRAGVSAIGREIPSGRLDIAVLQSLARRGRGARWRLRLASLAGAAAVVLGLGLILMPPPAGRAARRLATNIVALQDSDVLQMVAAHDLWAAGPPVPAGVVGHEAPARLDAVLHAAGIGLVRRLPVALGSGRAAVERDFAGPGTCRLSLFAVAGLAADHAGGSHGMTAMVTEAAGTLRLASWSAGTHYLLLGRGMDGMRFAALAQGLAAGLGDPSPSVAGAAGKDNTAPLAALARLFADPPLCGD